MIDVQKLKSKFHKITYPIWSLIFISYSPLTLSAPQSVPEYKSHKSFTSDEKPQELDGVGITQHLGKYIDLNLKFMDQEGKIKQLSSFFDGKKPVILSPVYFSCPGLCNYHLNGLTEGLKELDWNIGEKFNVLSVSFDPQEKPELAKGKQESYWRVYGRSEEAKKDWHFLTGDQENIKALMDQLGFNYKWVPEKKEWAHASAAIIISPDGKITRYLPGISFTGKDLKLAINEGSGGKIGTFTESLILYCFQYDQHKSQYSIAAFRIMKLGGGIMVLLLALWLIPVWLRTRRQQKLVGG